VYSILSLWRVCVFSFPSLANAPSWRFIASCQPKKHNIVRQRDLARLCHFFISCAVTRRKMNFHLLFNPLSLFVHVCALSTCLASFFNYSVKKLFSRARASWKFPCLYGEMLPFLSRAFVSRAGAASGHASPDNISPTASQREKKQKAPLSNNIYTQWYQNKITFVPLLALYQRKHILVPRALSTRSSGNKLLLGIGFASPPTSFVV
jgi:hypothetical protein